MTKYRAVVYDNDNDGFWRFSRQCDEKRIAFKKGLDIAKKYSVKSPKIIITEEES